MNPQPSTTTPPPTRPVPPHHAVSGTLLTPRPHRPPRPAPRRPRPDPLFEALRAELGL